MVSWANKHFEEVQNWLQTTLKQRKTWWNQKSLGCLFTIRAITIWRELVLKCFLPHFDLHYLPLHWSSTTENTGFKEEFTLSSSSVKIGFTDIAISILEKPQSLRISSREINSYRGFARQPYWIAGQWKLFALERTFVPLGKIIYCSCHPTWLPCKTSIAPKSSFSAVKEIEHA